MSNEELCMAIKECSGNDNSILLQLMQQNKGFIYKYAIKWAATFSSRPDIDIEDLTQSAFFAVLEAVQRFEPDNGTFLNILSLTLKTAFSEACGVRTEAQRKEPLYNHCSRFESPASGDHESDLCIGDLIPDESSAEGFEAAECDEFQRQLSELIKKALSAIPSQQSTAIEGYYLQSKTQKEIADDLNVSPSRVQQIIKGGLKSLQNSEYIPDFKEMLYYDRNYYRNTGFNHWKNTGNSVQQTEAEYKERIESLYDLRSRTGRTSYLVNVFGLDHSTAEAIAEKSGK